MLFLHLLNMRFLTLIIYILLLTDLSFAQNSYEHHLKKRKENFKKLYNEKQNKLDQKKAIEKIKREREKEKIEQKRRRDNYIKKKKLKKNNFLKPPENLDQEREKARKEYIKNRNKKRALEKKYEIDPNKEIELTN